MSKRCTVLATAEIGGHVDCLSVLWRMSLAVLGTWAILLGVFLLPGPFLSKSLQPVVYSHATVALWMLGMAVAPIVVLVGKWEWIRTGRWRRDA